MLSGGNGKSEKLTTEQKKKNHIISEHKRREAIKDGFNELQSLIKCPDSSKAEVLTSTIEYIKNLQNECEALHSRAAFIQNSK